MKALQITFNGLTSSPEAYDDWFEEERGSGIDYEIESDADEVEFDSFDDRDE